MCPRITGFLPLPVNNFKYFLTLFSKFFASFPHGTCSLSVSRRYLALGEIYLPFRAAFPNNPTRRKRGVLPARPGVMDGVLTLYDTSFQRDLYAGADNRRSSKLQFGPGFPGQI